MSPETPREVLQHIAALLAARCRHAQDAFDTRASEHPAEVTPDVLKWRYCRAESPQSPAGRAGQLASKVRDRGGPGDWRVWDVELVGGS